MAATSRRPSPGIPAWALGIPALGLAALALVACETRAARVAAPKALLPHHEGKVVPCGADKLRDIMQGQLHEALGRARHSLFHDTQEERMQAVVDATGLILGCAEALRPIAKRFDPVEFDRYLARLQQNALALQIAALEADETAARHWYLHLRQSCTSCHAVFRGGTTDAR